MEKEKCILISDRDILGDALLSEKYMTALYNGFAGECKNHKIQSDMLSILREEHTMQNSVFEEMEKRGLYPVITASVEEIEQEKTKFENMTADF